MPVTTIPQLTGDNFAQRLGATYPNGWAAPEAIQFPGGVGYGMELMAGNEMSFELDKSLQFALNAMRIGTAQDTALDLAGLDFFGLQDFFLPRNPGENDILYAARILAALLPSGCTRAVITNAVTAVTGSVPRVIEYFNPADTGVWDGGAGQGMMFWDVDNVTTPFRWTDNLPYNGWIEAVLPQVQPFGNNQTPAFDVSTEFYWDVNTAAGAWFMEVPSSPASINSVYATINRKKVFGTVVWVRFTNVQTVLSWDQTGLVWDSPFNVWPA